MAEIEVYGIGSTKFSVKLIGLQTNDVTFTRKCLWTVYEASNNQSVASTITYITPGDAEGGDFTFTGMSPNTGYFVYCYITRTDTGGYLTSLSSDTFYTNSSGGETPVWNLTEIDLGEISPDVTNTIKFTASSYQTYVYSFTFPYDGNFDLVGFNTVDCVVCLTTNPWFNYESGDPYDYNDDCWDDGVNHNLSLNVDIEKNTTYYLFCRGYDETVSGYCEIDFQIFAYQSSIAKWDWYSSNGSASANVTLNSYYALNKDNPTSDFSHLVWNDMVDKVMRIIESTGNTWWSEYSSYYDTKMHSKPYELTADMFNSLRYNIGARYSTRINEVSPGDCVYADYFITLTNCMNEWIDTL